MVTTTCKELNGSDCRVPLTGGSVKELQQSVFAHAQKHHPDVLKKMSTDEQTKMMSRIREVYEQKAGVASM